MRGLRRRMLLVAVVGSTVVVSASVAAATQAAPVRVSPASELVADVEQWHIGPFTVVTWAAGTGAASASYGSVSTDGLRWSTPRLLRRGTRTVQAVGTDGRSLLVAKLAAHAVAVARFDPARGLRRVGPEAYVRASGATSAQLVPGTAGRALMLYVARDHAGTTFWAAAIEGGRFRGRATAVARHIYRRARFAGAMTAHGYGATVIRIGDTWRTSLLRRTSAGSLRSVWSRSVPEDEAQLPAPALSLAISSEARRVLLAWESGGCGEGGCEDFRVRAATVSRTSARTAVLAHTTTDGNPFGSIVKAGFDRDGNPVVAFTDQSSVRIIGQPSPSTAHEVRVAWLDDRARPSSAVVSEPGVDTGLGDVAPRDSGGLAVLLTERTPPAPGSQFGYGADSLALRDVMRTGTGPTVRIATATSPCLQVLDPQLAAPASATVTASWWAADCATGDSGAYFASAPDP